MNLEAARPSSIQATEALLFDLHGSQIPIERIPAIFILGSPRTGSTLLYQLICRHFSTVYFSNHTNDNYSETPSVGIALERTLFPAPLISLDSNYGKTKEPFEPSEGSAVFTHWFGGQHPSQIHSTRFLTGKREHFERSMRTIFGITHRPIVTKNAWNVFRIEELAAHLKSAIFIWVRRDIATSALSDLEARYRRGGPQIWNSATTWNYQEIQKQPYWEQVVEQQYWYNKTISADLERYAKDRFVEVWYEKLATRPEHELHRVGQFLNSRYSEVTQLSDQAPIIQSRSKKNLLPEDFDRIQDYILNNQPRLEPYRVPGATL
jgi:hypothetical protein